MQSKAKQSKAKQSKAGKAKQAKQASKQASKQAGKQAEQASKQKGPKCMFSINFLLKLCIFFNFVWGGTYQGTLLAKKLFGWLGKSLTI